MLRSVRTIFPTSFLFSQLKYKKAELILKPKSHYLVVFSVSCFKIMCAILLYLSQLSFHRIFANSHSLTIKAKYLKYKKEEKRNPKKPRFKLVEIGHSHRMHIEAARMSKLQKKYTFKMKETNKKPRLQ